MGKKGGSMGDFGKIELGHSSQMLETKTTNIHSKKKKRGRSKSCSTNIRINHRGHIRSNRSMNSLILYLDFTCL